MSSLSSLGIGSVGLPATGLTQATVRWQMIVLRRLLNSRRLTIDDVVNNRGAKNEVIMFYRLYHEIQRRCDVPYEQPIRGRVHL